jgi:hypothetical protein
VSNAENHFIQIVDDNGELVLLDNKGNVIRGETKELLRLLKQNIIEEELRVEEEERRRLQEEGLLSYLIPNFKSCDEYFSIEY